MRSVFALALLLFGFSAHAEYAVYGAVELQGLSRYTGSVNPPGLADVMVCNVNGPDGFLAVRSGPGSQFTTLRKIERLAIVRVDSESRSGRWLYATLIYRTHSKNGYPLATSREIPVQGWVHDGYLCDFIFH